MSFKRKCQTCSEDWELGVDFCPADGTRLGAAILDRYELVRSVAKSAMSEVFEVRHIHTGRRGALKLLHSTLINDEDMSERLRREAQSTSAIGDPNIVNVTDFGDTDDGGMYMVMEWIEGSTLRDALEAGPIPPMIALEIAAQVAQGLASAHLIGIVHRDIKPENIMVFAGADNSMRVKILDFGVAKLASPGQMKITRTGTIVGTPAYISPEQARGLPVDERADIYSLGCILYELLTDTQVFQEGSSMEMVMMHAMDVPEKPSLRAPDKEISSALDETVMRCMEKEKENRYPSMATLKDVLRKHQSGAVPQLDSEETEAAHTFIFESQDVVRLAGVARAARASSQPVHMPLDEPRTPQAGQWKPTAILVGSMALVAAVIALLLSQDPQAPGSAAASASEDSSTDADASVGVGAQVMEKAPAPTAAVEKVKTVVKVEVPVAGEEEAKPAEGEGGEGGEAAVDEPSWRHQRKHAKFSIELTASPRPIMPKDPIKLGFKLSDFTDKLSWAVTESRLRAEVQFVHFVSHDTLGSLSASVDDTGSFDVIFSVPRSGKYHLMVKFKDGSRVVGRTQMDMCVGIDPDDPDVESICPHLNEFTGHHGPAR